MTTTHDADPQGVIDPMTDERAREILDRLRESGMFLTPRLNSGPPSPYDAFMRSRLDAIKLIARLAAHDQSDPSEGERE